MFKRLQKIIKQANNKTDVESCQNLIDSHYGANSITVKEFVKLDSLLMDKAAELDIYSDGVKYLK